MTAQPLPLELHEPEGGYFDVAARRSALTRVLPTLGTYFATSADLTTAPVGVARDVEPRWDDDVAAGLRLRVALAATRTLSRFVQAIAGHPTFRYQQFRREEFDLSHGALDVTAYLSTAALHEAPRRYPVAIVERTHLTPENVLLAYTVRWLYREIRKLMRAVSADGSPVIPVSSEDYRAGHRSSRFLSRILQEPFLRSVAPGLAAVVRDSDVSRLIESARRRLRRREVPNPQPYSDLVAWISDVRLGVPVPEAGATEWQVYDARFDTRLFEVWCLQALADSLSDRLAAPLSVPDLRRRSKQALIRWQLPFGQLDCFFQRSPQSIDATATSRWRLAGAPSKGLVGIPDLCFQAGFGGAGPARFAFVDPKLRRRPGAPTEEVFKLLGYFNNYRQDDAGVGAIIYYTPTGEPQRFEWKSDAGRVLAVGVDPTAEDRWKPGIDSVADLLLDLFGVDGGSLPLHAGAGREADDERLVATRQSIATQHLMREAARLGTGLRPAERALETALGLERWRRLPDECRTMLATAQHLASAMDEGLDHSGPVLGTCAAIERVLVVTLVEPTAAQFSVAHPGRALDRRARTLGGAIRLLRRAVENATDNESNVAREVLAGLGINSASVESLLPRLTGLNTDYRIPAAHSDVLSAATWRDMWQLVYTGQPDDAGERHLPPLLAAVVDSVLLPT